MYFDQRLLLPESSFLDRFTDAAWEAVRDAPSEEAYARHMHLNNALLDLKSGAVKTTREIKPGDPLLLTKTWAFHQARQGTERAGRPEQSERP